MKHVVATALVVVTLTGCATSNSLIDGLLGRYHNYDAVEYQHTVNLVMQARGLEESCAERDVLQYRLFSLDNMADELRVHAEGRPYNSRMVNLTDSLIKMIQDTTKKSEMSEFFCRQRSRNIVKAAETIRTLSGEKPE